MVTAGKQVIGAGRLRCRREDFDYAYSLKFRQASLNGPWTDARQFGEPCVCSAKRVFRTVVTGRHGQGQVNTKRGAVIFDLPSDRFEDRFILPTESAVLDRSRRFAGIFDRGAHRAVFTRR